MKRKGLPLGYSPKKHGDHHRFTGYYNQQLDPVAWGCPLTWQPLQPLLFWLRSPRNLRGIPFNHFCTSCSRSFPEFLSHSTFLIQPLHLLWSPFVNCSLHNSLCCDNLNPAPLLPSITEEVPYDYLIPTHHPRLLMKIYRKFPWVTLTSHDSMTVLIQKMTMANIVLGMLLQLILMLLRQHLYLRLLQPDRLNYILLHRFVL